ncbi:MAG: molybdopterin-dependent oxidoreductase [Ilumatobacteraceae bacterium]
MAAESTSPEVDTNAPRSQSSPASTWSGPFCGLLAAVVAVCVGLPVAAILDVNSPLDAVGSEFIDRTPKWLKIRAVDWFGTNDKLALRIGMVVVVSLLALGVGILARRWPRVGPVTFGLFGLFGGFVAIGRPAQSVKSAVPALVGAIVGAVLIGYLIGVIRTADPARKMPGASRAPRSWDRRRFVIATGTAVAGAVVAAVAARRLEDSRLGGIRSTASHELPPVATGGSLGSDVISATPEIPADATLSPVTSFLTPNDEFYLIDTALSVPRIRLDTWAVDIGGRVEHPLRLTYDDLLSRPQVERVVTIACVSNEVGGDLIGNAVWQGVLLADLLAEVGVQEGATQVFGTSIDGWTCGFPLEVALDGRDAMIAIGMNGEQLPLKHGFPARVIVPGLYGYVSATKWLSRIDLTTWDEAVGYWVPRGWARDAPIKTQSRIDVPRRGEKVKAGRTAIAGIAWAQHRGVVKVEVRIGDGEWQKARLGADVTVDAWRQWIYEWNATPGKYVIQVRATDRNGDTQTEEVSRPDPDGATGWHTRIVTVTG